MNVLLAVVGLVVFHLDFNTIQMKKSAVVDALRVAAAAGYNAVLWEVENKVRWETCPECVHPEAFTKSEFRELLSEADRLGLEPIPLMQTFGHAEYVLRCKEYAGWMEDASFPACYCPSRREVRAFLKRLLDEYLELFGPKVRHFHLGGDEALVFGTCPTCRKRNKMDLYVEHLEAISAELSKRGIRPGVWADMMLIAGDWSRKDEPLPDWNESRKLSTAYTLWNWDYGFGYAPEKRSNKTRPNRIYFSGKLKNMGYRVIICGASQSGGDTVFLPFYARHRDNLSACAELARKEGHFGFCCTSWSVHLFDKALQYPLVDFAAKRYLNPLPNSQDDYNAAVGKWFGAVDSGALDRLGMAGAVFMGFDARQRDYLKPAIPAEPGLLASRMVVAKRGGKDALESRISKLRKEAVAIEKAQEELGRGPAQTELHRELIAAGELKKSFVSCIADVLEGKSGGPLPIADTTLFYRRFQTPQSSTNSAALVWSVLMQDGQK